MSKTEDRMTGKQRAFARALAMGDEHGKPMSISDCYRECYNTENMSDAVIRNEASKLASHRGVTMMVERLRREKERNAQAQAVGDRERVLEALRGWMLTAEPSDSAKISAAKLLGETQGMFKQHQTVETVRSSDELLAELDAMLEQAEPDQPTDQPEPESGQLH
tara:strand:- start:84 stop:575 length:492 start_codon:yes stop_codon:yes gene_type:complete